MIRWITHLIFRFYRVAGSARYWIPRRFTPTGLGVLAALVIAVAIGANLEQALGFQSVMILICLLAVSISTAPLFRDRFKVERVLPRFGCVNETLHYRIWLTNLSSKPQIGLQLIEDFPDARPDFQEFYDRIRPSRYNRTFQLSAPLPGFRQARTRAFDVPALAPRDRVEVSGELTPLRRGPLHFLSTTVARPDPFGLFRGFRREAARQTILILPRRHPVKHLALPGRTKYQHGGVALASGIGESEEFTSLREYRRGDSLRRIHWRSWARLGRPIVKEFQDEYFVRHALVLDTFCDIALRDVFEDAVSVAASFACTIPDQDALLDLMFVGPKAVCLTSGRSVGHTEQMLEVLAAVTPSREKSFADLTSMVIGHANGLSGCILVLMAWDEPRRELVRTLNSLRVPMHVFLMTRPGEADQVERGPAEDQPDRFTIIEGGHVAEALARL
ncbi:MAG TPA: DUF58 domain-containing protein [Verrucomicrobiales bacterium]|nr:DUF58 domain-containing protein [Verrucomicrobiales bacterium]